MIKAILRKNPNTGKTTLGDKLDGYKGFGPGFDFCRLYLALSVIVWHSTLVFPDLQDMDEKPLLWMAHFSIVPMFYSLSGFLVTASAQRLDLKNFLLNRGARLLPALFVEVLLSALVLGPIFTVYSLGAYFHGYDFYAYFLNIFGIVHYELPGVFLQAPLPKIVNISLWTEPIEMLCYALMSFLIITKCVKRNRFMLVAACLYLFFWLLSNDWHTIPSYADAPSALRFILEIMLFPQWGPGLVPCFLLGVIFYNLRYRILWSWKLCAAAAATLFAAGVILDNSATVNPSTVFLFSLPLTYIVIFLGLCRIPRIPLYSTGDYSYGIYLYSFPLQQALIQLMPGIGYPAHAALSVLSASLFAAFSWHFVEKPVLRIRKDFAFIARQRQD